VRNVATRISDETASIDRPVPPAEVGGGKKRRDVSLLDVLLGN